MEASRERSPSVETYEVSWEEVEMWMGYVLNYIVDAEEFGPSFQYIYGVPRGGLVPAVWLSHRLGIPLLEVSPAKIPLPNVLVVEDVVDTGKTVKEFEHVNVDIVSLVRKPWAPKIFYAAYTSDRWVKFPWEKK